MADQFPASFFCPLTFEVMRDPVVDPEGNSYERSAIEEWLRKENTSPITRTPLQAHSLVPNRALKDLIEERAKELGVTLADIPARPSQQPAAEENKTSKVHTPSPEPVTLNVSARRVSGTEDEYHVLASVVPVEGSKRTPVDVCCVIDVSGSMNTDATFKNATGATESRGLNLLDIVKHSVKTISYSLTPEDRLGIVTFSSSASEVQQLTFVDEDTQTRVDNLLSSMRPQGGTNLYQGLLTGLEMCRKHSKPGRVSSLLLLTDGQPSDSPPSGEIASLKRYIEKNTLPCSVNTFGFGYEIKSDLLCGLADAGCGMYSFIPDSSFVGTVFVNTAANLLTTMGTNVGLSVEPLNNSTIISVPGRHKTTNASWGSLVSLPPIQYGQSLDIVIKMKIPKALPPGTPYADVTLKFDHWNATQQVTLSMEGVDRENVSEEFNIHPKRLDLVDTVMDIMDNVNYSRRPELAQQLHKRLSNYTGLREKGLLEDASGQIMEAAQPQYYEKWGKHYLPSLAYAHQRQQCNNFKDPGIQFYGGEFFKSQRELIEDVFIKLPPPGTPIQSAPAPAPVQSYAYNNTNNVVYAQAAAPQSPGKSKGKIGTLFSKVFSRSNSSSSSSSSSSSPLYASSSAAASNPMYAPSSAASYSMADYYNAGGGCFDGSCTVRMHDGTYKKVEDITQGDRVYADARACGGDGGVGEVVCVVKIVSEGGRADLVELEGGLKITPYHPVRIDNKWTFPCSLSPSSPRDCAAVYTFVLHDESTHTMVINNVECVTLGHHYTDDVVAHAFFGSNKVIHDLRTLYSDGWAAGRVVMPADCFVRDARTHAVCGLRARSSTTLDLEA